MQRFKNILLVIDKTTENKATLDQAIALCKRNQAHLTVINIVEALPREGELWPKPDLVSSLRAHEVETRQNHLNHLVEPLRQEGIPVTMKVLSGVPFLKIIQEVLLYEHDLVMMTADGEGGLRERLFGSTSMHLMRKCPCPVWVVKPQQPHYYARILAAIDPVTFNGHDIALDRKIMDLATSLARRQQAELHIVHTWFLPGESVLRSGRTQVPQSEIEAALHNTEDNHKDDLNKFLANYDLHTLRYKIHLLKGEAKYLIPPLAQENKVDLIVMGTVARTGVAGFFIGNTAETVLSQADCSVLTVKPDEFVTPVKLETGRPEVRMPLEI